ncbi:hypothetical protein AGOR_G00209030 [Albula goreensis]|uniref:Fibronectin type-III domain-containing protein n=1 Tax=Albula goreensis TaxID=1534307 RepID=A0A8T3CQA2_9TELE|nr:hypothetical protein AGOR_G00209030 [Albula goreensis]
MRIWTTLKLLLSVLIVIQVQCFQDGLCPQKETPHGAQVLRPGSALTLHCNGWITVDGVDITHNSWVLNGREEGAGEGVSDKLRRTSRAGDHDKSSVQHRGEQLGDTSQPRLRQELDHTGHVGEAVSPTGEDRRVNGSQLDKARSDVMGDEEKANASSSSKALGAAGRVERGLRDRTQWKVNGHPRTTGGGGDRGDVLHLAALRLSDSGVYSCQQAGREVFSIKIIVAAPPEQPTLSCIRKTPTSKIRCDWTASQHVTPTPQCYLILKTGLHSQVSRVNCSFSPSRARCWCVMEHPEGDKDIYLATLCVTSIAGNATSPTTEIHPVNIIKPDPPRNVTVHKEEGKEHRLKVTWNYPVTWRPDFYLLEFQLQYYPILNGESMQVQSIDTKRLSYTISDILPRTTYQLRIRAREEFHMGQWSDWSSSVKARSWTDLQSSVSSSAHSTSYNHTVFPFDTGEGSGSGSEPTNLSPATRPPTPMLHLSWVFGVCALMTLTVLAIYILRHREQFITKLLKLGRSSTSRTPAPSSCQKPREEGNPLVSPEPSAPPLSKEPPYPQEEDRAEGIHLHNMGYFLVQAD